MTHDLLDLIFPVSPVYSMTHNEQSYWGDTLFYNSDVPKKNQSFKPIMHSTPTEENSTYRANDVNTNYEISMSPISSFSVSSNVFFISKTETNICTKISFHIKDAGNYTLEICNSLGKTIKTLLDKKMKPGNYELYWNGLDADGCKVTDKSCFCRIISNGTLTNQLQINM